MTLAASPIVNPFVMVDKTIRQLQGLKLSDRVENHDETVDNWGYRKVCAKRKPHCDLLGLGSGAERWISLGNRLLQIARLHRHVAPILHC